MNSVEPRLEPLDPEGPVQFLFHGPCNGACGCGCSCLQGTDSNADANWQAESSHQTVEIGIRLGGCS
jgi:hypothetical protein